MRIVQLILLSFVLSSCGTMKETNTQEDINSIESKPERNVMLKAKIGDFEETDFVTIESARIDGNKLFIDVTYSGGCKEHTFDLIGNAMVMKSLPPKRSIQLVHHSNDDSCRSVVSKTIEVDIRELAFEQTAGSEIVLILDGWDEQVTYIFE